MTDRQWGHVDTSLISLIVYIILLGCVPSTVAEGHFKATRFMIDDSLQSLTIITDLMIANITNAIIF